MIATTTTTAADNTMTAGGRKKFLFDTDFSPEASAKPVEAQVTEEPEAEITPSEEELLADVPPTFTEEDMARSREEGFQAGHTEATRDLTSALEQRLANTMDLINAQIANLFDAFARDKEEHSRDAVAVATVIVRKLFPALNMDKAMDEIEHMIVEAMQRTSGSPTLIVRVSEDMKEAVESKVAELAALRGREGTVTVMADPKMTEGDAAIEWDGGGMIRDSALMWQEIDDIIERNLGSKRAADVAQVQEQQEPEPLQEAVQAPTQEVVNDAAVEDNENLSVESQEVPPIEAAPAAEPEEMQDPSALEDEVPNLTASDDVDEEAKIGQGGEEMPDTPENSG